MELDTSTQPLKIQLSTSFLERPLASAHLKISRQGTTAILFVSKSPPKTTQSFTDVISALAQSIVECPFLDLFTPKARQHLFKSKVWQAPITLYHNIRQLTALTLPSTSSEPSSSSTHSAPSSDQENVQGPQPTPLDQSAHPRLKEVHITMLRSAYKSLSNRNYRLFQSAAQCVLKPDISIEVGTGEACKTFHAHRDMLVQYEYFSKLLTSGTRKSQTSTISFPEDDPTAFSHLLNYLYTHTIEMDETTIENAHEHRTLYKKILQSAQQYQLQGLIDDCYRMKAKASLTTASEDCAQLKRSPNSTTQEQAKSIGSPVTLADRRTESPPTPPSTNE